MAGKWNSFCRILHRRRVFEPDQLDTGNLKRCLSVWDLTALGVGSSLGVGVYVLIGSVARHLAGPSIILSFLIAAVAAIFAGICYAELGSRVPKAGSAYIYTYVTVGEFVAFVIGWDMILEAIFGTASVARGLSMYVDSMTNNTMSAWFESVAPIYSTNFSPYFDFFSFFVVIILGVLLGFGVRESTLVNNVFTAVNIVVILFIIIAGAFKADVKNWSLPPEPAQENEDRGEGGFFPYGVWGMLKGAAVCFYGFVGFDSISSTGEEVRDPRRAIPLSIMGTQVIVFVAYAAVATIVTMMMPYYLQEKVASVATSFTYVGMDWARWVVTLGAIVGITASLYGSMFPLPRLLYSMATDGLLMHWLARVTTKRKSPMIATLLSTVIIAILAAILELNELILMMCIGTLMSYTVVACCVIILRYRSASISESSYVKQMFGLGLKAPTKATSFIMNISLVLFICTCVTSGLVIHHVEYPIVYVAILHSVALLLIIVMTLQPQLKEELTFKTPLVPLVPCLSIYVNINLMMLIKLQTWIRVIIWMAIGIPIYFLCVYCYKQNVEENLQDNINACVNKNVNGKAPVQIYVVSPTPPDTISRSNKGGDQIIEQDDRIQIIDEKSQEDIVVNKVPFVTEEVIIQHAYYEDNEEKEAKIIDLLDQVLQAEEDSYAEILSLKENNEEENVTKEQENDTHRKSLSELSDAGSDASMGNQVLSKYDVIAEVHREDLPIVNEEEERSDREETDINQENDEIIEYEDITAFNDSDTNSQTDESGYSDTIDKTVLCESVDNLKEDEPKIPVPPPLDENFFAKPSFQKSYTISVRPPKPRIGDSDEEGKNIPRTSVQSNSSYDDTPMVFGSDKQMSFMSKLNNIFQNKIASENDDQTHRRRSNSTGNPIDNSELVSNKSRPLIFFDLKKEITSQKAAQNLRPVNIEPVKQPEIDDEDTDTSLSREDLKSKLESLFAAGGPKLSRSRVMKSNPPTPEESYQTDTSSNESIPHMPKIEKNDTLGRQRTKFGEVLNSFRLTLNKDDNV